MKKFLSLILVGVLSFSMVACSGVTISFTDKSEEKNTPKQETVEAVKENTEEKVETGETKTEEKKEIKEEIKIEFPAELTKDQKVAYTFMKGLQEEDASLIISTLNITEDTFMVEEDVLWILPRTQFADFVGLKGDITIGEKESSYNGSYTIPCAIGDKTMDLEVILDNNNEWKIIEDDMFLTNLEIQAPKGTTIFYNNAEFTPFKTKTEGVSDYYIIPAVVNRDFTVKVSSELGEFTSVVSVENRKPTIVVALNEDQMTKETEFIFNTLTSVIEDYRAGMSKEDLKAKHFPYTPDVSYDAIYTALADVGSNIRVKVAVSEVAKQKQSYNDNPYAIVYESDKYRFEACVSLIYNLSHTTNSQSSNNDHIIVMIKDGQYFLYDFEDYNVFNW